MSVLTCRTNVTKGNSVVTSEHLANQADDCAPCADSDMTLKEKMAKLDDMELVQDNESNCDKSDDEA